tara:strand:- start:44410 stop:44574 length:165 start_codon:yes stop_codon:yes gene_type:complete
MVLIKAANNTDEDFHVFNKVTKKIGEMFMSIACKSSEVLILLVLLVLPLESRKA